MKDQTDKKIALFLTQNIVSVKDCSYELIIKSLFNKKVKKFDINKDSTLLNQMAEAMKDICKKSEPIKRARRNEVGNDMENIVISALNNHNLPAEKSKTAKGKTAGYPDIKIKAYGSSIYLEVKTFEQKNRETSLRSFYLSPSKDPKIIDEAFHLLVGFEIIEQNKTFIPVKYEIVDLYGLKCDLKYEFNSNNKRLYNKKQILIRGDKEGFQKIRG